MFNPKNLPESLRQQEFQALTTYLEGIQRDFEQENIDERQLQTVFDQFGTDTSNLSPHLNRWLQLFPEDYVVLVAVATWLCSYGAQMRGLQTSAFVTDQGYRSMAHCFEQAQEIAARATGLTENPLSACLILGKIQGFSSCQITQSDIMSHQYPSWYQRASGQNPHSLLLPKMLLGQLRTEWGGDEQLMLLFVRQVQERQHLSQSQLQQLWGLYHAYIAHYCWQSADDMQRAIENAALAASLDEAHGGLLLALLSVKENAIKVSLRKEFPEQKRGQLMQGLLRSLGNNLSQGLQYAAPAFGHNTQLLMPYRRELQDILVYRSELGNTRAMQLLYHLRQLAPELELPDPLPYLVQSGQREDRESAQFLAWIARNNALLPQRERMDAILSAANLGSAEDAYDVVTHFAEYQKVFQLDERGSYQYILQAADGGHNLARCLLARMLLAGQAELGEDGLLRPVDTRPTQRSLDYARHLLGRAASEDDVQAHKLLSSLQEKDWKAETARRKKAVEFPPQEHWKGDSAIYSAQTHRHSPLSVSWLERYISSFTWWHWLLLLVGLWNIWSVFHSH